MNDTPPIPPRSAPAGPAAADAASRAGASSARYLRDGPDGPDGPAEPAWTATVTLPTAAATTDWGKALARGLRAGDLIVLAGGLGAGKTTLTQGIGAGLQVRGRIASPTFIIARSHAAAGDGPALVHVDAYRLTSLAEVDDLDLDASMAESVTVVEWGAGMVEDLAVDRLEVELVRARGAGTTSGTVSDPEAALQTEVAPGSGIASDAGAALHPEDVWHPGADPLAEPRIARVRGYGPRWSSIDISEVAR